MAKAEFPRYRHSVAGFIYRVSRSAHCKCSDVSSMACDGPTDQTGIDATAQQRANRYIGMQPDAGRLQQQFLCAFNRFFERHGTARSRTCPVSSRRHSTIRPFKNVSGRYLRNMLIDAPVVCDKAIFEKLDDRSRIDSSTNAGQFQSSDRGSKGNAVSSRGINKGLYTQAIAYQKKLAKPVIPQSERKHAAKAAHQTVYAPF